MVVKGFKFIEIAFCEFLFKFSLFFCTHMWLHGWWMIIFFISGSIEFFTSLVLDNSGWLKSVSKYKQKNNSHNSYFCLIMKYKLYNYICSNLSISYKLYENCLREIKIISK